MSTTLDELLHRAHDAEASTSESRQVIYRYEVTLADRELGVPGAWSEDTTSSRVREEVRAAAHEVAQACRIQLEALRALATAADAAGYTTTITREGTLREGLTLAIDGHGIHLDIYTYDGIVRATAWREWVTASGIPEVIDLWAYQLPALLGIDPAQYTIGGGPR